MEGNNCTHYPWKRFITTVFIIHILMKMTCALKPPETAAPVPPTRYNFKLGKYNVSLLSTSNHTVNVSKIDTVFDSTYFGVYFQPAITKLVTSSRSDVAELLKVINTKFSNIIMKSVIQKRNSATSDPALLIPTAVAQHNKKILLQYLGTQNVKIVSGSPMKVFLVFNFDVSKSYASVDKEFETAWKLANDANKIYPGTVSYLIANVWTIATQDIVEIGVRLNTMHTKLKEDAARRKIFPLQLGVSFSAGFCNELHFNSLPNFILTNLNLVLIFVDTNSTSLVEKESARVLGHFKSCKAKIVANLKNIKVGLFTGWHDTGLTPEKSPGNIVRFWGEMNNFSRESHTPVFLLEAFDNPNDKLKGGWWTLEEERVNKTSISLRLKDKYIEPSHTEAEVEAGVEADVEVEHAQPLEVETKIDSISATSVSVFTTIVIFIVVVTVVWIAKKKRQERNASFLPEQEIVEFFEGSRLNKEVGRTASTKRLTKYNPYDRTLEIAQPDFAINSDWKLGSGSFGTVYFGQIIVKGEAIKVAVKRANTKGDGITCVKNLLSEIKVLSYVGKHENIVTLLGAHTKDIEKGQVYAFLELCSLGCLKNYLEKINNTGSGTADSDYLLLQDTPQVDLSTLLVRWSVDIVQGMDFLASKNVVHADLATRNVLLDKNKMAKICDFGLSQNMLHDDERNFQKEHLPWRWMAPEALRLFKFTEKTDVWSFGVTLWEIYTLGKVPYTGVYWNYEFLLKLENGLRLQQPKHDFSSEAEMYKVMLRCWEKDVDVRPNFAQLKTILSNF